MATLGNKAVLFGGSAVSGNVYFDDTWEWDGNAWTKRIVSAPTAREGHAMATLENSVVLFGGNTGSAGGLSFDTWKWNGNTWSQVSIGSGPSARAYHAMATR